MPVGFRFGRADGNSARSAGKRSALFGLPAVSRIFGCHHLASTHLGVGVRTAF
jgi:hypothetical protein